VANDVRVMLYVDGFNLYFGLRTKGWKRYYWLDVQRLGEKLLRPNQSLVGVKYFTADIRGPADKHRRQQTYLDALSTYRPNLTIMRGHYLIKKKQCRRCAYEFEMPEEKKTDVNISTQMLVDAFLDRFDVAILISGDSDLVPPIEAIRQHRPQKRVVVAFPPARTSEDLKRAAHAWFWINEQKLRLSLLPNPVVKPNGHELYKPTEWK